MGIYPMVPYPLNDHSIEPGISWTASTSIMGRSWTRFAERNGFSSPHAVSVDGGTAKANVFEVARRLGRPSCLRRAARTSVVVRLRRVRQDLAGMKTAWRPSSGEPGVGACDGHRSGGGADSRRPPSEAVPSCGSTGPRNEGENHEMTTRKSGFPSLFLTLSRPSFGRGERPAGREDRRPLASEGDGRFRKSRRPA